MSWWHKRLFFFIRRIFYKGWKRSCASVNTYPVNTYRPRIAIDRSRLNQQMMIYPHSFLPVAVHATLEVCMNSHCRRDAAAHQGQQLKAAQIILVRLHALSQEKKGFDVLGWQTHGPSGLSWLQNWSNLLFCTENQWNYNASALWCVDSVTSAASSIAWFYLPEKVNQ